MSTLHMSTLTALSAIPPMIACVLIPPPGLEFHSLFLNYLQKTGEEVPRLASLAQNASTVY